MVEVTPERVVDTRETPFLIQFIAWANVALGLLLLIRFLYFSSAKNGHTPILIVALIELAIALPLAFGAHWAYLATKVVQPLNLAGSVWLLIATHDPAPLLPVVFYAVTTFFLLAPARMTGGVGITERMWSAERRYRRSPRSRPDLGTNASDEKRGLAA